MPAHDSNPALARDRSSFQSIFSPIEADLQKVRQHIGNVLETGEPMLQERMAILLDRPGKMIRPALVLLAGKACGAFCNQHIELAAIVELIHSATLLHDDVIDGASIRRKRPCANALWGNTAAVLLGDFLLSRALSLGVEVNLPDLSKRLTKTAEEICRGELLQNLHRDNWELTESQYFQIIDGKTAALFACSTMLGAVAAGANESTLALLEAYGRDLGRAFQIRDDLLDLLGNEEACGKTLGTDLAEKKPTLPLIVWLHTLPAEQRQKAMHRLSDGLSPTDAAEDLRKSGAAETVRQTIQTLCKQAGQSLESLSMSHAKEMLLHLAEEIALTA